MRIVVKEHFGFWRARPLKVWDKFTSKCQACGAEIVQLGTTPKKYCPKCFLDKEREYHRNYQKWRRKDDKKRDRIRKNARKRPTL